MSERDRKFDPDWLQELDPNMRKIVAILHWSGIETYESCQSGKGHCFPEPTVRFHGGHGEGFRALAVCFTYGIRVSALRRMWQILDGEPDGPHWELTFLEKQPELADMTKGKLR